MRLAALLLPPILAAVVLAAHFYRSGNLALAVAVLGLATLLAVPRRWAARAVQLGLLLGAVEWVRTLATLVAARLSVDQPYLRLALILGAVALATAAATAVFRAVPLRRRYRLDVAPERAAAGARPRP